MTSAAVGTTSPLTCAPIALPRSGRRCTQAGHRGDGEAAGDELRAGVHRSTASRGRVSPTGNASGTRRLHSIQPDPSAGRGAGPCGTAAIRGTRGLDAAPYRETLCMQWQRAVVLEHVVFAGGEVTSQPACTHLPVDGSVEPSM